MENETPLDSPEDKSPNYKDLTPEQGLVVIEYWNTRPDNPPSLVEICEKIYGRVFDGRSIEMRAIKKFLSERSLKTNRGTEYNTPEFVLTEEHKLFIVNNAGTMSAVEMGRILLNNSKLSNLDKSIRVINEFIKTLDTRVVMNSGKDTNDVPDGDYRPPKRLEHVLARVNQYVNLNLDVKKLTPTQKKGLESLTVYLHTYRLIREMNSYDSKNDRDSCEDAFIRYTWNKPDLSQEEVDQYIILANEVVMAVKAKRRMEKLQQLLEQTTGNDSDNVKISMSLTEAIGKANTEFNACIKRQADLFEDLTEKRSKKLEKQIKDNASILNLVELWKNEESRRELIELGKKEQEELKGEVQRMKGLPDIKLRILGITDDEAIY